MRWLARTILGTALWSGVAATGMAWAPSAAAESAKMIVMQGIKTGAPACSGCHGAQGEGLSAAAIPRLAGLDAGYLLHQLDSFADGKRKNGTMTPIASSLTQDERKAVAAYYAKQSIKTSVASKKSDTATLALGGAIAKSGDWTKDVPGCSQCHGPMGSGVGSLTPRLAGQSAEYIEAQLKGWASGSRQDDPMGLMAAIAKRLNDKEISAVAAYYAAYPRVPEASVSSVTQNFDGFTPPPDSAIPKDQFGEMVKLGLNIFRNTPHYAKAYVGNSLSCENCHLDAGRMANSAPLWAAYVSYPAYRSKNKHVNDFPERLQGCFRFSMNGKPPARGSKELLALETYSYFLAKGAPTGAKMKGRGYPALKKPAQPMNFERGKQVYAQNCAMCHGADGQGQKSAAGKIVFPPLWGSKSFNWGAGMGNIKNAAAFIKANMPFSKGNTLSDQEAWDVAMFVDGHERPQDPRFTGSVPETRKRFHNSKMWLYGTRVDGVLLGAHSVPSGKH